MIHMPYHRDPQSSMISQQQAPRWLLQLLPSKLLATSTRPQLDAAGIGGGASGASAGLLHPYSPKGTELWRGREGVRATLALVQKAARYEPDVIRGTGILRRGGLL